MKTPMVDSATEPTSRLGYTPKEGISMTQDNARPVRDESRPFLFGGLAIIGVGLAVLLRAPAVREACRRVLQDPEVSDACREVVARVVARSPHPGVGTALQPLAG